MKKSLTVCASHLITLPSAPFGPVRAAVEVARDAVSAFDPELVVFFGTDHRRAFRSVVPTFAVVLSATAQGDVAGPSGSYDVPSSLGRELVADLVAGEFDIATAYSVALDHAFGHTARDLLGSISAKPVLPVFINCASPPHATFRRAASLGRRVGEFFADRRVLYVGSGGLAHDLPGFREPETGEVLTEEERQAWIKSVNERARAEGTIRELVRTWDEAFLAGVGGTSWEWLDEIGVDLVERGGNGAAECLTWTAAWAAGGQALTVLAHEFDTNGRAVVMS
ncbi:DODA-type extradiol aromatic ring-opening family dioxygenase [Lentzea terrae]|uniref:DODA-type extradiol aromatic ring-opening family dioxygenase n=1 Tax=Lentzea terrae TaxID=2200761 RepID=UPI000DD35F92|nr:3-carboxyethylcatechol 2,3-dioxygenase [Lentzea terrae]